MRSSPLVIALVVIGCAPAPATTRPNLSSSPEMAQAMAQAQQMAALGQAASMAAEVICGPIRTREVGFEEERAIGQELAISLTTSNGHFFLDGAVEKDPQKLSVDRKALVLPEGGKNGVSAHVAIVGRNLARASARPDLPWVFGVIENETPNAFSTAGGYVFVTTGLLKKMTNEAQLAGVLAHEIGHVTHKHSLKKYVDAKFKQCVAANYAAYLIEHGGPRNEAMASMAAWAKNFEGGGDLLADAGFMRFIMQVVVMLMQLPNDKDTELQTDRAALELVSFAGYDASEYEKFLVAVPQQFHPAATERAEKLKALREGELKDFTRGTAKPDLGKVFAPLSK